MRGPLLRSVSSAATLRPEISDREEEEEKRVKGRVELKKEKEDWKREAPCDDVSVTEQQRTRNVFRSLALSRFRRVRGIMERRSRTSETDLKRDGERREAYACARREEM